ncbi:hypothetical protein ACHWQZ_G012707 [Mnemiopsis leidyi]
MSSFLSLRIKIVKNGNIKTIQFKYNTLVSEACQIIRDREPGADTGDITEYGLFKPDEDAKKGTWLDPRRTLEYYLFRAGDQLEYRKKIRPLRVKMLDDSIKTILIDDSHNVKEVIKAICERIGINNPDEFSLVVENLQADDPKNATLRKDKTSGLQERDRKKMETLRKKLHTDDDILWLNHEKSLREQGVPDDQMLLLRKKLFFSDINVDRNDPVQLNLMYIQDNTCVLNGTHKVSQDDAVTLAAIRVQIQFGNHDENKHKKGFLELKDLLPSEYRKVPGMEKKIFAEHRKLIGMTELNGKLRYIKYCRELKTYGVTFFLVKEKMKGKNKLVPRLLGITKEKVMRVDEKTKEVIQEWQLTTVRRWAASPNSFTLDFGDYSESYYSVQTQEGEKISQLISQYIDLIMKNKTGGDRRLSETDEEATVIEDQVRPGKAMTLQNIGGDKEMIDQDNIAMSGILRPGDPGKRGVISTTDVPEHLIQHGGIHIAQSAHMGQPPDITSAAGNPQQAHISNIMLSIDDIERAKNEMAYPADLPPLDDNMASKQWRAMMFDTSKHNIHSHLVASSTAAAGIYINTPLANADPNYLAIGTNVSQLTSNMTDAAKNLRMLMTLQPDGPEKDNLLAAANRLAGATQDLLNAAKDGRANRAAQQAAINAMADAHKAVLGCLGDPETESDMQMRFLDQARLVAQAVGKLVNDCKEVARSCSDPEMQGQVINASKDAAASSSQLVTCIKLLGPTMASPLCQQQLMEAAKGVAYAVEGLVHTAQNSSDDQGILNNVSSSAEEAQKALDELIRFIKQTPLSTQQDGRELSAEQILDASDKMFNSMGNTAEMVQQAKIIARATSSLVHGIKLEAESQNDSESQTKLLGAAKQLADATARMVEAAKAAAMNPNDEQCQLALQQTTEDLRQAANNATSENMKAKLMAKLQENAKIATAASTQLLAAANGAERCNGNPASQEALMSQCKMLGDAISKLVGAINAHSNDPNSDSGQLNLVQCAQQFIAPATRCVSAAKSAVPHVTDQAAALQLSNFSKSAASALVNLRNAANRAGESFTALNVDNALDLLANVKGNLKDVERSVAEGTIKPLPRETPESCTADLYGASKQVGSSMVQLLTAANQGNANYTGIAARETANHLGDLIGAVRGICACTDDRNDQNVVIDNAKDVLDEAQRMMEYSKVLLNNPDSADAAKNLHEANKAVSHAIHNLLNSLPGQKDVDSAIKEIARASVAITDSQFPPTKGESLADLQNAVTEDAAKLNQVSSELVAASRVSPEDLAVVANNFANVYGNCINHSMQLAGATKDAELQSEVIIQLKNCQTASNRLLSLSKLCVADPTTPHLKNNLTQSARSLTDSINNLLNACTSSVPGQKECDNAIRNLETLNNSLQDPSVPVSNENFFDCIEAVVHNQRILEDNLKQLPTLAKANDRKQFASSIDEINDALTALSHAAAQTAYLVGVSDPNSTAATPGIVDPDLYNDAHRAISSAIEKLTQPDLTQQEVLAAATQIAQHTSKLCNACKAASQKCDNPVAKRHFVQCAKDVANSTAQLVKSIKALATKLTPENRAACREAATPLLVSVEHLRDFALSPEFAPVPAKISPEGKAGQQCMIDAGNKLTGTSTKLLQFSRSLALNPNDGTNMQLLITQAKSVSNAVKDLLEQVKQNVPGQKPCDQAIEKLRSAQTEMEQAAISATAGQLKPQEATNLQGYQTQLESATMEIKELIEPLAESAKCHPEKLGHHVATLSLYFDPVSRATIGAASKLTDMDRQQDLFSQARTLMEAMSDMLATSKDCGGNPNATALHPKLEENVEAVNEAISDLRLTIEMSPESGLSTSLLESIAKSRNALNEPVEESVPVMAQHEAILNSARAIAGASQDMVGKASLNPDALSDLAQKISESYETLVENVRKCADSQGTEPLKDATDKLANPCSELVKTSAVVQSNPKDTISRRELSEHAKGVARGVHAILQSLQQSSQGTQACIDTINSIVGITGDLETMQMFARTGALENTGEPFSNHRENILGTAKKLVENTKQLVAGAAADQGQLKEAALAAQKTISDLAEAVKRGAGALSIDDVETQVMLLNACMDVAKALSNLIDSTKDACGKSSEDPSMDRLKSSAKEMVQSVSSLLKTVKSAEDKASRGTRALEIAVDAVSNDIKSLDNATSGAAGASPEDLIRAAKEITIATTKAVAAGNTAKQDDIAAAGNMGRKAITDMLNTCKGASVNAESEALKLKVLQAGRSTSMAYRDMLEYMCESLSGGQPENSQLIEYSKKIAESVKNLIGCAEELKSGADWVNPDDPNVIAENELLNAAASIEAAAKKLSLLQPRKKSAKVDENLNFEGQILEAAKAIAAATSALVRVASATQRELARQGKVTTSNLDKESIWSEGLVGAARMVAAATSTLCEAANAAVQGNASEEKLIASAKGVANSTAQLLMACMVKADQHSENAQRLQTAGNKVKKAADVLVKAAQSAAVFDEQEVEVRVQSSAVYAMAAELQAQEEILRRERELEQARKQLAKIRHAQTYSFRKLQDNQDT